jgi:thiol-disulfide isomerase/thioredoxin
MKATRLMTTRSRSRNDKAFWLGVAVLALFGVARVAMDARAQDIMNKKAPHFELDAVNRDGKPVTLEDYEGKVVVLDFWAVWCGPCEQSLPFFQRIQDEYGKHGLEVIGVHVEERMPSLDDVNAYLEQQGVRYTNLVGKTEVDDAFLIFAMPTTYLVDREGVLVNRHIGFNPARTPEKLEADVREMLGLAN